MPKVKYVCVCSLVCVCFQGDLNLRTYLKKSFSTMFHYKTENSRMSVTSAKIVCVCLCLGVHVRVCRWVSAKAEMRVESPCLRGNKDS